MAWFKFVAALAPLADRLAEKLPWHKNGNLSLGANLGINHVLFGTPLPKSSPWYEDPSAAAPTGTIDRTSRDVTVRGTSQPCVMIYGEALTPGFIAFAGTSSDTSKIYFVVVVAHHQCEAITEFKFDGTRIYPSEWASGTTNLVSNPQFIGEDGTSKLKITVHLGTNAQTVDSDLTADCPQWDSTHVGKGVCYYVVRCTYDKKAFPNGPPQNFFALVKGRRLYDPRLDSTNGGSGSHRYTDATTWAWSDNPALCKRDYLTGGSICYDVSTPNNKLGLGEANSRIDDAFVIAAANNCDGTATIPIPVLAGRLNWSNGSANVSGIGTNFTKVLANGNKLLGPDSNFYTINSISSDTLLQLTGNYTGTTTNGAVTQWNTTTSTTTTQKRFTCNTIISTGQTHSQNLQVLASSMLGPMPPYTGGKFRIFSGVYDSPAITINEEDILGSIEVPTHQNGEDLYNLVQGTFFDEDKDWQQSPFPPQTQSSYQTDDGGLEIRTISLEATRTNFRAQRMSNVILNKSRNKIRLFFSRLSQKAMLISEWDTFYVNCSEYGWVNQIFRCINWQLLPDGFVSIEAHIESSSSYSDLASTDYVIPRNANVGSQIVQLPSAPTSLTINPQPGAISFFVGGTFPANSIMELWEHTSSSPFSSATKIAEGVQNSFTIYKGDTTLRYYWARSRLNGQISSTFPASTGSGGQAGLSSFVARGNCFVSGSNAMKLGGSSAWDSDIYSINGYNTCHVAWKSNSTSLECGIGLNSDPTTDQGFTSIDYWFDCTNVGTWTIYISGSTSGVSGTYTTATLFSITADGSTIRFYADGVQVHSVVQTGSILYMDSSFYDPGAGVNSLRFGPTTNLAVVDNSGIGPGAVSPAPVSSSPSDGTQSYPSVTQPQIESSGINATASLTPSNATGTSRVDVTWSAQAKIDVTTSGGAVGTSVVTITIQVNGSTVFTKEYSIEGTASIGDYITVAGSTNVSVPAGQTVDAFFNSGRHFTTGGSSPAQVHSWKAAHLSVQAAMR